jgi:hypothetical protein
MIESEIPLVAGEKEHKKRLIRELSKDILRAIPIIGTIVAAGTTIAEYVTASSMSPAGKLTSLTSFISNDDIHNIAREAKTSEDPTTFVKDQTIHLLQDRIKSLASNISNEVTLYPGNSTIQVFTLRTNRSILFSPSTYNLNMEIEYNADSYDQRDIIAYPLSIAASVGTMMFGAGFGSALGYFVKDIFTEKTVLTAVTAGTTDTIIPATLAFIANIVLGVMSVLIFSRKKDVQTLITIEDFWGGVLVGFVVGYMGKAFFEKLLPAGK